MNIDFTTCCDRLADAIWWFKGYAAARKEYENDLTEGLAGTLADVRRWWIRAASGERRVLDWNEHETAFVLTEGEYERIADALRPGAAKEDVEVARTTIIKVNAEIRAQQAENKRDPEIPF